jgi:hypothetical protein
MFFILAASYDRSIIPSMDIPATISIYMFLFASAWKTPQSNASKDPPPEVLAHFQVYYWLSSFDYLLMFLVSGTAIR